MLLAINPGTRTLDSQNRELDREELKQPVKISKDIPPHPKTFEAFNEMIGLPLHPATLKPCKMTGYQIEYDKRWSVNHKLIVNKSRKIGATDSALRSIAYRCLDEYVGHSVMIVAGNRQSQANIFLERFDDLFKGHDGKGWSKEWTYEKMVRKKTSSYMELAWGVQIYALPALPTALRGLENVKCVFFSEAAHINRLEDSKVYTALRPITSNDPDCDFIIESTPNGKRGFFFDLWAKSKEFDKLTISYDEALGLVLSEKDVLTLKNDPKIDFEQEYNCKFTSSQTSAFEEEMVMANYESKPMNRWQHLLDKHSQ